MQELKEDIMDPSKVKKALEIAGAVASAAVTLLTVIINSKDGRKV
jgi:hypothetical protein